VRSVFSRGVFGAPLSGQAPKEQLDLLDKEMQELVAAAAANDTQKLLAHGRFLEQKFQKDDIFAAWVAPQPQKVS
jgi:hypothetical protein